MRRTRLLIIGAGALLLFAGIVHRRRRLRHSLTCRGTQTDIPATLPMPSDERLRTRQIIIGTAALLLFAGLIHRKRLQRLFNDLWNAQGSPVTLAAFRIVLFTTVFLSVDRRGTVWYSRMPEELRIAPFGMQRILPHLPITRALARAAATLLLVFSALAAAGLFTPVAAGLTVLFGIYVFGIPHLFGKVNHLHHHLIWFAALMAVSPCADVLSCDAIARAWRRVDAGDTSPPVHARKYALPLRFVWLLIGLIYFFPGFWKLWRVGFGWTVADNIKFQLYSKWAELGLWKPPFRVDRYPALCALGGMGTIAFETSVLPLVFSRRSRPWLAVAGPAFHNLTGLFMRISFPALQAMYGSFLDWDRIFRWLGLNPAAVTLTESGEQASGSAAAHMDRFIPATAIVGTALLAANTAFGLLRITQAWPFACYPPFDFRATAERSVLTLAVQNENGQLTELPWASLSRHFGPERARGLQEALLSIEDPETRNVRFRALWRLWRQNHPDLGAPRAVQFFKDTLSIIPEERHRNPLRRELLANLPAHG
jgi:hypothetical protein